MPYRRTPQVHARLVALRERIVEAALAQVAEGEYTSASVIAIAARAGIATGTVYRHFPSKSALFTEVFRRASQHELETLSLAAGDGGRPARERLADAVTIVARRALRGRTLAYALLAEPVDPAVESERLVFRRAYRDVFAGIVRDGIARGELPEQDPEVTGAGLVGAIGETLVGPLSRPLGPAASRRLVSSIVAFCVRSLHATEEEAHVRA